MNHSFGFIVPTKDRIDSLNRLLQSIYTQSVLPKSIIIVDGSLEPVESKLLSHQEVEIVYVRVFPPSLTVQRNAGVRAIPKNLDFVGFLDDDLVLLPRCLEELCRQISAHDDNLGGLGFNILEEKSAPPSWILKLLGLHPKRPGLISRAGSVVANINVQKDFETQFLPGGATLWRTQTLQSGEFDEHFHGYSLWEDVDFSFQASQKWKLVTCSEAKVLHLHQGATSRLSAERLGDLEIVDRFYFCKKHSPVTSVAAATWASFGTAVRNALVGLQRRDSLFFFRVISNLRALVRCVGGRIERRVFH